MFCFSKFNLNIGDIGNGVVNVKRAVDLYVERKVEEHQIQEADFLRELLFIRDDHLVLSNTVGFTREELESLINYICTYYAFSITCNHAWCYCFIYYPVCSVHDFIIK